VRSQGFNKGKPKTDNKRRRKRKENTREQNQCRFCRSKTKYVDYKALDVLGKLLTHRGKIFSRKRSGNCASCQRKVRLAIKRARFMGLLPFTS